jgi:hypothetical protein
MEQQYDKDIDTLKRMIEDIRSIRDRTCEPKTNENPRYHALSMAISGLNKAIGDMRMEAAKERS